MTHIGLDSAFRDTTLEWTEKLMTHIREGTAVRETK